MLILKNPLALQSISAFGIYSDSLGEKICGNYQTFGAAVTGEDLIHMTMQEPAIYVGIENNGPFLVDNQIHVDNQVRMELINRLVNRLMLYPSPQFTYQDEVFVATVLQKLGIADVNEFMQQVKIHMEKNELAVSLINKYFDEGRVFADIINEMLETSFSDSQETDLIKNEYQSDSYLHNEIFRRLMTAECSNAVYSYQNPVQIRERLAGSFHEIEWMRQADRIQLSQLRANIFWQTNPAVFCDYSNYETKPLSVSELTKQKIIGRMSAAVLENIVNVAGYTLLYEYGGTHVWKDYSTILYGSSENTLERFQSFQERGGVAAVQCRAYTVRMNELTRDELYLTQLLEFVDRSDVLQVEDTLYENMRQSIVLTMLENQNLQKQLTREIQIVQQMKAWEQKNENDFSMVAQGHGLDENADKIEADRAVELLTAISVENVLWERAAGIKMENGREIKNVVRKDYDTGDDPVHVQTAERGQAVYELIYRYAKMGLESDVPLMENIELLEQINQHNLYMKQLLDSKEPVRRALGRVVVDRAQARAAALRALDHPEQVLREVYENAVDGKKIVGEVANRIPDEIERILSVTDERTRSYYERLMGYRNDDTPNTGSEYGERYREETVTSGQSEQETAAEDLFPETIKVVLTQEEQAQRGDIQKKVYSLLQWIDRKERVYRTDRVVQTREDFDHNAVTISQDVERNVQMVHKTREWINQEIVDDVLETVKNRALSRQDIEAKNEETLLTQRQNEEILLTQRQIGETLLTQRQIEEIRNELVVQCREQIAHMVGHEMETYVHKISDRVYLELERRLKNEQRRRGY